MAARALGYSLLLCVYMAAAMRLHAYTSVESGRHAEVHSLQTQAHALRATPLSVPSKSRRRHTRGASLCADAEPHRPALPQSVEQLHQASLNRRSNTGRIANPAWRAIPEEHLRSHPLLVGLPDVDDVVVGHSTDLSLFRQSSWQWDVLHRGRLTTSKAAACLGFYEVRSSGFLNVPPVLRSHRRAITCWNELQEEPVTDFNVLNPAAKVQSRQVHAHRHIPPQLLRHSHLSPRIQANEFWHDFRTADGRILTHAWPFDYRLSAETAEEVTRTLTRCQYKDPRNATLAWGSLQEPVCVLAVLNHFAPTGARVAEVGLCAMEGLDVSAHANADVRRALLEWRNDPKLPLVGASPDGLVLHLDGSVEVIEAKSVSPFKQTSKSGPMRIVSLMHRGVAVWHIPQIQLEMLCIGPHCQSSIVSVLSACSGAALYRVDRDDAYIVTMLAWLEKFVRQFVHAQREPVADFFRAEGGYRDFLEHTKKIARSATLVRQLAQHEVQRSCLSSELLLS